MPFYVTVTDNPQNPRAGRVGFLLGPYPMHKQAIANIKRAKRLAAEADPWSHFYGFGVSRTVKEHSTLFGE
jgi:hypothetical protein